MLVKKGKNSTIKLIDFGLSRQFFKFTESEGGGEIMRMETRAGTKLYMAPEVFKRNYSNACDIWSLGVILYIMVSSQVPFEGNTEDKMKESILNFKYDFNHPVWNKISDECKDLISKILVKEEDRITPKEALIHPWMELMRSKKKKREEENKKMYMERIENFKDSSHLKKAILSFLSSKVNDEDIKEEIDLFNSFDENNDGYITKKELRKGLKDLQNKTDKEVEEIMASMDTDQNGAINFNEFISATLNSNITNDYERILKAFEFFDLDNDGLIDENELKEALSGKTFSKIDVNVFEEAIKECDLDKDGKINFDEFAQIMSMQLDKLTKANIKNIMQV